MSLDRIELVTIALAVALAVVARVSGHLDALGIVAGAAFMIADFRLIRTLVSLLITPGQGSWGQAAAVGVLTLKFLLAVVLVAAFFYQFPISPMSFATGVSLLLIAAVLDAAVLGQPVERKPDDRAAESGA